MFLPARRITARRFVPCLNSQYYILTDKNKDQKAIIATAAVLGFIITVVCSYFLLKLYKGTVFEIFILNSNKYVILNTFLFNVAVNQVKRKNTGRC